MTPQRVGTFLSLPLGLLFFATSALAQDETGTVSGSVLEEGTQRPLVGADVILDGTPYATIAGEDGRFELSDIPAGTHVIRASLIGYGSNEEEVTLGAGQSVTVEFSLQPAAVQLDALVAVGYGTQRRRIGRAHV